MTSSSATRTVRRANTVHGAKGDSPLRHWPWALLTAALLGLLAVGWSATSWFPENAPTCERPECTTRASTQVAVHWVGMLTIGVAAVGALLACVRSRPSRAPAARARLSPLWHGAVIGITVMLLATITLWPTVRIGMLSPPLGVATLAVELVLLAVLLDRMHLAARPSTSPRARLRQSLVVAAAVVSLEVALPLVSPFRALSAGMLQIALVQAGVAVALTSWLSLRDPAPHEDRPQERRTARLAALATTGLAVVVAVTGLHLGPGSAARFAQDVAQLVNPW